jgi:uncharacterized membrane protein
MAAQSEIPPAVAATDDDISSPAVAAESSASGSGEWDKPECDRLDDVSIATVITATVITIVITIVTGIVIIVFVAVLIVISCIVVGLIVSFRPLLPSGDILVLVGDVVLVTSSNSAAIINYVL